MLEGGRGRGEVTGQKMAQNEKKFCLTLYLGNCTSYDCVFWNTCKMMISPAIFSLFSKVWFFGFFIVHQWMAKGNSEVCSTFTCVWFFNTKIRNLFHIPHFWKDIFTMWDYVAPPLLCVEACIFHCTPHMLKPACIMSS